MQFSLSEKKFYRILSIALAFVMLFALINVNSIPAQAKDNKKIVILYFSATGTTKAVAKKIKKYTNGKLIEIKAADAYTSADIDWADDNSRVTKEHNSASSPAKSSVRPKIKNLSAIKKAVKKADVVYIGYPIWWGEAPHIVYSLVENISLKKKTVIPFCTSMSSGLGSSAKNLKKNAIVSKKTKWLKGRNFFDIPSQKKINKWIKALKVKKI